MRNTGITILFVFFMVIMVLSTMAGLALADILGTLSQETRQKSAYLLAGGSTEREDETIDWARSEFPGGDEPYVIVQWLSEEEPGTSVGRRGYAYYELEVEDVLLNEK